MMWWKLLNLKMLVFNLLGLVCILKKNWVVMVIVLFGCWIMFLLYLVFCIYNRNDVLWDSVGGIIIMLLLGWDIML